MKGSYISIWAACALVIISCSPGSDIPNLPQDLLYPASNVIFYSSGPSSTRATETAFENNDQISVFAVQPATGSLLKASGNYADNVLYTYQKGVFSATKGIRLPNDDEGLAYYAVYPYQTNISSQGLFRVQIDQETHSGITLSDFCTAYTSASTSQEVWLDFNHRMSRICIDISGNNLASKAISMRLNNVCYEMSYNLNTNTFIATSNTSDILMGETYTNHFEAIMVPQSFVSGTTFLVVTIDGEDFPLYFENETSFRSGKEYDYLLDYTENKIEVIKGDIKPWNTHESDCYVVPANEVALYDRICWEYSGTSEVKTFQWMILSEEELSKMTENDLLVELSKEEKLNYADDYVSSVSYDNHDNRITEKTIYYIITIAYDTEGLSGPIRKTIINTPAYMDEDVDAWVYFDNIEADVSTGFWFDAIKQGKCSTYHLIYGNYYRTSNSAVYAFEINYYIKNKKKHWLAENWDMEIRLDNVYNSTFNFATKDLSDYPICVAYGWGLFNNGALSSDLIGFQWDISKEESVKHLKSSRKAEIPENITIVRSVEEENARKMHK